MLKRFLKNMYIWWTTRRNANFHSETLFLYRRGTYPKNPTIGIGQAYANGLLDAQDLCKYEWTSKALHEGPIFLKALRKAGSTFKLQKKFGLHLYQPSNILDLAMSQVSKNWNTGWVPESLEDTRSSELRIIHWVHAHDPNWISNHLDSTLFSSSMSVWGRLLYHDTTTSAWAMQQWPTRFREHTFPWKDWVDDTAIWLYPIMKDSCALSRQQWLNTAMHMSAWSPLKTGVVDKKLRHAIGKMGFPDNNFSSHRRASDRGLLWRALTYDVPASMADPIGAALACAWPDMHPDCIAIKRHFYPALENATFLCDIALSNSMAFTLLHFGAARATASLYEAAEEWVAATIAVWEQTGHGSTTDAPLQLELPSNFMD